MARTSITLTCTRCGNEFKHIHFSRNQAEASSYEAWAVDHITVCPDCHAAEQAAKQQTALEEYMASFGEHQLPEISGVSEKQIAYAEKLRAAYVADLMRARIDIPKFFQVSERVRIENLNAAGMEQAKAAAAKAGKSLDEWFAEFRPEKIKLCCRLNSTADVRKIPLIFTQGNASKLIDALK